LAIWERASRLRDKAKEPDLATILGFVHVNKPLTVATAPARSPRSAGSAPSTWQAPPDRSAERELASATAAPDGTVMLLPGRLEIVSGYNRMKEIRFPKVRGTDVVTFGRQVGEAYSHVRVDSSTVSRLHASMRYTGGHWFIRNLSATNPVELNGEQLTTEGSEQPLQDGDRVDMGEVIFRFRSR
jgi:pSer/pThr/pTyr-binding forkhead associated (FHA) protein